MALAEQFPEPQEPTEDHLHGLRLITDEQLEAIIKDKRRPSLPTGRFLGRLGLGLLGLTLVGTFLVDRAGDRLDSDYREKLTELSDQAHQINSVISDIDPEAFNQLGPAADEIPEFFEAFEGAMEELGILETWTCEDDLDREDDLEGIRAWEDFC